MCPALGCAAHGGRSEIFKEETEQAVNGLKSAAHVLGSELAHLADQSQLVHETVGQSLRSQQLLQQQQRELQDSLDVGFADVQHASAAALAELDSIALQQERLDAGLQKLADDTGSSLASAAELARQHHGELLSWHATVDQAQKLLAEGSAAMLHAQDDFVDKQATLFMALDRLFSLHRALLSESHILWSLILYPAAACVIYLLSSSRSTHRARFPLLSLLLGSCATEWWLLTRCSTGCQLWGISVTHACIFQLRTLVLLFAASYLLVCFVSFRDYASLSYKMLKEQQKVLVKLTQQLDATGMYVPGTPLAGNVMGASSTPAEQTLISGTQLKKRKRQLWRASSSPLSFPCELEAELRTVQGENCSSGETGRRLWWSYVEASQQSVDCEEDADYVPPSWWRSCVASSYTLRPRARLRPRPMAASAAMLAWETVENFMQLVHVNQVQDP
eukprot:SM000202S05884  [mRNA]  locus=s202:165939:168163:+ [translate_table: standard]